jgi:hypothetical protein
VKLVCAAAAWSDKFAKLVAAPITAPVVSIKKLLQAPVFYARLDIPFVSWTIDMSLADQFAAYTAWRSRLATHVGELQN